ncbi:MAG: Cystathionine beta-lyase metC [Candidatus Hodgkinia cicadicola]|nr:MAG: Cystathionine beta-lyase metC [Candidatus Hodgkinia cicadicola]
MSNFVNVDNINARLDSVSEVNAVLGRLLADNTMLIRMFNDIDSGFVNSGITGGSTVLFKTSAEMLGRLTEFSYGIHNTPTVRDLCAAINLLDESEFSMLTPSGLSALTSVITALVKSGDHVLIVDTAYEPLREFCCWYLERLNVSFDFYDPADDQSLKCLLRANTRLVHLESPGSGTFEMQDVKAICDFVHNANPECFVSMDNTWATPLLFKPIAHGVDLSVNAMTKYPSGASDLMMGAISANKRASAIMKHYKAVSGLCGSDHSSYCVLKGLKSLSARMVHHHINALEIAKFLETVSGVVKVLCPALPSFSYYRLWKRDYSLTNSTLSFVLDCSDAAKRLPLAKRFLDNLKVFGLGWSWGGYKSLAAPVLLAHRAFAPNFGGPVLRLHIGLECLDDLMWDLEKAFKSV